jgi:DNA adenine methylase
LTPSIDNVIGTLEQQVTAQSAMDKQRPGKPILKWAGGKTQLLPALARYIPNKFNRYIEPFVGGGALFFSLRPRNSVLADSNPELINLYKSVSENVEGVIEELKQFKNTEEMFYEVRGWNLDELTPSLIAARTIYLNRTCFNGLYRVNKKGQFNTPFGRYKNPKILDEDRLRFAASNLKNAKMLVADFRQVLGDEARTGDFIFLDPPYIPVSEYSDFKRYTSKQFTEDDHRSLAQEATRLRGIGCHVVLTNSNHPLVHDLYSDFDIEVIATKRNMNSNGAKRVGEDVVIYGSPLKSRPKVVRKSSMDPQVKLYPSTRFMGSKSKLLTEIWDVSKKFKPDKVLDLFSGSGAVAYMFKAQGCEVMANDYMAMSAVQTTALVVNNSVRLTSDDVTFLLSENADSGTFVQDTFKGLYFKDEENALIDTIRFNITQLKQEAKQSLAMASLMRASLKKRPRGLFTYVGHRYDDGRRDLRLSFEEQFREAVTALNNAVFDNGRENISRRGEALEVDWQPDLVYIDPPYYGPYSDNEYVRRYHFLEGLACNWQGVEMQWHTKTKKFKSYPTPFSSRTGASDAFDELFRRFADSTLVVSYSSNSLPDKDEMVSILNRHKKTVEVHEIAYRYSSGTHGHKVNDNRSKVSEYLFVAH